MDILTSLMQQPVQRRLQFMFVVLDGNLEVRAEQTLIRVLSPGDVFGEMAFLLEQPRSADVYAATDGPLNARLN